MSVILDRVTAFASIVSSIVSAGGIVLLWRQISAEHERCRREKAIEIMNAFIAINPVEANGLSRLLMNELDKKQSTHLFNMQDVVIDSRSEALLKLALAKYAGTNIELEKIEGKIVLRSTEVFMLRALVLNLLNSLESMASAWRHNIADRDMLEDEFQYIVVPYGNGGLIYEDFIIASGGFLSLKEFAEAISRKENVRSSKRKTA